MRHDTRTVTARNTSGFPILFIVLMFGLVPGAPVLAQSVFINEIHYDNASTDAGEAIEVAGPAGTNLAGWTLLLYNGTYDAETRGGRSADGRRVRGTSHWVSAAHALTAEVRLYGHLFAAEDPADDKDSGDFKANLNPDSVETLRSCQVEPSLADAAPGSRYQFLRQGYFCVDSVDSSTGALVFNRTVSLRDTWARMEKGGRPA